MAYGTVNVGGKVASGGGESSEKIGKVYTGSTQGIIIGDLNETITSTLYEAQDWYIYSGNEATGDYSVAIGVGNKTTGMGCAAIGWNCTATGSKSSTGSSCRKVGNVAIGLGASATGSTGSVAISGTSSGTKSVAITGSASGNYAVSCGGSASGQYSFSSCRGTASGEGSAAFGDSTAAGTYSATFGIGSETSSAGKYQTVVGKYNKIVDGPTGYSDTTGSVFVVGVGTGTSTSAKKNGLRVGGNGYVYGSYSFQTSGADYAEYFEWLDGNPENEDRRGKFVTLDGEKIRIAEPDDEYILGVVSTEAAFVGNTQSEEWHGRHMRDVFGRILTETVNIPDEIETLPDGTERIIPAHTEVRYIDNPEYDADREYEGRDSRPEWSPIGLLGKLVVCDDGTCEVNGYASVGEGGLAVASDNGYRVMARIDENHVKLLIR